jgi:hypothetical protein
LRRDGRLATKSTTGHLGDTTADGDAAGGPARLRRRVLRLRPALFVLLRARPGAAPVQAQVVQLPLVRTARTTRTRGSLTPSHLLPHPLPRSCPCSGSCVPGGCAPGACAGGAGPRDAADAALAGWRSENGGWGLTGCWIRGPVWSWRGRTWAGCRASWGVISRTDYPDTLPGQPRGTKGGGGGRTRGSGWKRRGPWPTWRLPTITADICCD